MLFSPFDRYACEQSPKRLVQLIKEAEEDAKIMKEHFQLDKDGDGDPSMEEKKAVVIQYLQRKNMRFHRTFERLGFLYYAYHENNWWYELVELSRKLILNGIIVLIPEAVTARVMVGLLTCLMYCIVVNLVRPYTGQSDFTLQIMCHTQLFVTMFAALLIKAEGECFPGCRCTRRPTKVVPCVTSGPYCRLVFNV